MRLPPVLLVLLLAPAVALAQTKPRHCLTPAEIVTEQIVRHGVFLRETGNRCDEFNPGTRTKWEAFNQTNGTRLANETAKRTKVFKREFGNDWLKVMTYFDGRMVTYYRFYPLTKVYCDNAAKQLDEVGKRGWGGFVKQAKVVESDVLYDYKTCR